MRRQIITGLRLTIVMTVLLGLVYPLVVFGIGRVVFRDQTAGSFVKDPSGRVVGSELLAQSFTDADGEPLVQYFQPRPSAAGDGYDARASGASNKGPGNPELLDAVAERVARYRALEGLGDDVDVPVDAVTASASGLDPHISVANARLQAPRVATARGIDVSVVLDVVREHTALRPLGFLGEDGVNVLALNLALDRAFPARS